MAAVRHARLHQVKGEGSASPHAKGDARGLIKPRARPGLQACSTEKIPGRRRLAGGEEFRPAGQETALGTAEMKFGITKSEAEIENTTAAGNGDAATTRHQSIFHLVP